MESWNVDITCNFKKNVDINHEKKASNEVEKNVYVLEKVFGDED